MTTAQTKSARRRMKLRYQGGKTTVSIGEAIARERQRAAKQMMATSKKK